MLTDPVGPLHHFGGECINTAGLLFLESFYEVLLMDVKPYLTIEEQLQLLKDRGLCIDDAETKRILHELNYYRLTGYMLTLKKGENFYPNVHFSDVIG